MAFGVSALPCRVSASCSSSSSGRAGVCGRGIVSAVIATTGPGCGRWSRKFRPEVRESGVPLAIDHMIGRTVSGEVKLRVDFGYNPVELDILRITAELRSTAAAASASAAASAASAVSAASATSAAAAAAAAAADAAAAAADAAAASSSSADVRNMNLRRQRLELKNEVAQAIIERNLVRVIYKKVAQHHITAAVHGSIQMTGGISLQQMDAVI